MTALLRDHVKKTKRENGNVYYYEELFSWSHNPDRVLRKRVRKERNPWMFRPHGALATHELPTTEPPVDVKAAFEQTFGNDAKTGAVRLVLHPFFNRWTVVQKWRLRDTKSQMVVDEHWRIVWMAAFPAIEGELAVDYRGVPEKEHLKGQVGAFRMPNRLDFEWIVQNVSHRRIREMAPNRCDTEEKANQWAATKINEILEEQEAELERDTKRQRHDFIRDHFSYYARLYVDVFGRMMGSGGTRTASYATTETKASKDSTFECNGVEVPIEARFVKVQREGYSVRARKGTRLGDEIVQEKTERVLARADHLIADGLRRRRAQQAARGVRSL